MKTKFIFFAVFIINLSLLAQVGINTDVPTAALDINGNLRIRDIQEEVIPEIATDSVLVMSRNGTVNRISSKKIINSVLKTAIKGSFSQIGILNLSLGIGDTYTQLPFDNEVFDYNNEFDVVTNIFTAKQGGIYNVSVQINSTVSIQASTNYGLCVLKNGVINAKENYPNTNISVSSINVGVSPTVRKVNTMLELATGDTISFQLFSDLLNVDLSANLEDSFFTIVQIR